MCSEYFLAASCIYPLTNFFPFMGERIPSPASSFSISYSFLAKQADTPANENGRNFCLSAFCVSCFCCKRLHQSARWRKTLRCERDRPGSEGNLGGCFRVQKSRFVQAAVGSAVSLVGRGTSSTLGKKGPGVCRKYIFDKGPQDRPGALDFPGPGWLLDQPCGETRPLGLDLPPRLWLSPLCQHR